MSDSRVRRAGLATASIIGLCLISACSEEDSSESGWSTSKLTSDSESYNAKAQFSGSNHFAVWQSVESREVQAGSEDLPGKTDHYTQSGHLDGHIHMLVKVKPIINMSVGSSGNWGIAKTWSDGDEKNERRISRSTTTNAVVATDEIFGIGFEPETSIATDSAGRAVAIWTELNAGVVNLYSCTYSGGWCATKSAVDTATNSVRNPQIALNSNGDGAAAWEQKENGAWTIYAASYNVGTGFGTPARISGDDGGATLYDAGSPQIAVSGTGVVLAVWKELKADFSKYAIQARRQVSGVWEAIAPVSDGLANVDNPSLSMNSSGNAVASWEQSDSPINSPTAPMSIWANVYDGSGDSWGTAQDIQSDLVATPVKNEAIQNAFDVDVAMNSASDVIAVWVQEEISAPLDLNNSNNTSTTHIWANQYSASGSSWGTAYRLENGSRLDAIDPQVLYITSTKAFVAWRQWNEPRSGSNYAVYGREYTGGWSSKTLLGQSSSLESHRIAIAANGSNVLVVFTGADGGASSQLYIP